MKRFSRYLKFVVLPFAVVGLALSACGPRGDAAEKASWVTSRVSRELDLNDEQKSKLDALKNEVLKVRTALKEGKPTARERIVAELKAEEGPDEARLVELLRAQLRIIDQALPDLVSKYKAFHTSLSAGQRGQIREKLEKFEKHADRHAQRGAQGREEKK